MNELDDLRTRIARILEQTPIVDIHTHLHSAAFGDVLLWGIDELLTYHYLVAEFFRYRPEIPYGDFWNLSKRQQAELIWNTIFVENTPISEAARGVVTTLHHLGLETGEKNLDKIRAFFAGFSTADYIDHVFALSNVCTVIMTNDSFNPSEQAVWNGGGPNDSRFKAALRLDPLLNDYANCVSKLNEQGFRATAELGPENRAIVREFLSRWIDRMRPVYMAVSLPPSFRMDDGSDRARLIGECVLPIAREHDLPFAMMVGVKKRVNPALGDAGDSVGKADSAVVEGLCRDFPDVRFLVTMLSRENQHELCVAARKFKNLLPFGCWWFLNNPSIVREITAERLELLGLTMIPQHSDARVLDQLIYKWAHSREIIADVLAERYFNLTRSGWVVTEENMRRDAQRILGGQLLLH
ncbi:MAG: glucuronate isomerase [Planctomycetes bacterium]|nr:glucuronate isomerase [Planctomycetota bacterium]